VNHGLDLEERLENLVITGACLSSNEERVVLYESFFFSSSYHRHFFICLLFANPKSELDFCSTVLNPKISYLFITVVTTTELSPPPRWLATTEPVFSAVFLGAVSSLLLLNAAIVI